MDSLLRFSVGFGYFYVIFFGGGGCKITLLWFDDLFLFGFCGISSMYFYDILFDCSNFQSDLCNSV